MASSYLVNQLRSRYYCFAPLRKSAITAPFQTDFAPLRRSTRKESLKRHMVALRVYLGGYSLPRGVNLLRGRIRNYPTATSRWVVTSLLRSFALQI